MLKMLRQSSETPNIRNIDDFVPFRHAYNNQNGFIEGKGNEISYTINGSEFRLNSGRIVLQGVESDIDANGVSLLIDVVSEKRYYSVYYKVNLATDSTSIETVYDIAGYPSVDSGDDLTENTSGSANLLLYRFLAENGVISEVVKIVEPIKYIQDLTVKSSENTNKVQGVDLKDSTPSQFGDYLIKKYKLLYSGTDKSQTVTLAEAANNGDHLIVEYRSISGREIMDVFPIEIGSYEQEFYSDYSGDMHSGPSFGIWFHTLKLSLDGLTLSFGRYRGVVFENGSFEFRDRDVSSDLNKEFFYISKVYKVIE